MRKEILMKVEERMQEGMKTVKKARSALFWARLGVNLSMLSLACLAMLADPVWAGDIEKAVQTIGKLIRYGSLIIGWGLGFMFSATGIMDLMRKDDDPRAGSKGVKKLMGGVGLVCLATLIGWVAEEIGMEDKTNTAPIN